MESTKRLTLLKVEGIFFAVAIVFFTVMFYFQYISKEFLATSILMFVAVLFSINVSIQQQGGKASIAKVNAFLSTLLFIASIGLAIYYYVTGVFTF